MLRMPPWPSFRLVLVAAASISVVVAGCTMAGAPAGSPVGPTPRTTPVASPSPTEALVEHSAAAPPLAWLLLPDGSRVRGEPGSWAIDGLGSEAPWLAASALEAVSVAPDAPLAVELGDGSLIGAWRADVAAATDVTGSGARSLASRESDTPPLDRVALPPLEAGSWVVRATVWFADGRGDAAYSWAIEVPAG
jgi:hypothetical protein